MHVEIVHFESRRLQLVCKFKTLAARTGPNQGQ